jgi:hypothetical protein
MEGLANITQHQGFQLSRDYLLDQKGGISIGGMTKYQNLLKRLLLANHRK